MKLGDSGAVLVEFAIILPVLLLLTIGMFEVGYAMVQSLQLTYATEGAAFAEATTPGSGVAWGQSQLPSASFSVAGAGCIAANIPISTVVLPLPSLSAQACWPLPPPSPPCPVCGPTASKT
jgi:Flp pilus assembly protein TadG